MPDIPIRADTSQMERPNERRTQCGAHPARLRLPLPSPPPPRDRGGGDTGAIALLALLVCIAAAHAQSPGDDGVILFCSGRQVVRVAPDGSGREVVASADMAMQDAMPSSDGRVIAWVRGTSLISHLHVRLGDGTVVPADVARGRNERFGPLSFRRHPSQLLFSCLGRAELLNFDSGERSTVASGDRAQWAGPGPQFIYETGARETDEEVGIHLRTAGKDGDELIIPYGTQALVSPDGTTVAYVSPAQDDDPRLYTMSLADRKPVLVEASTRFDRPVAVSTGGDVILSSRANLTSEDGTLTFDLVALNLREKTMVVLHSGSREGYQASLSPDGGRACFVARTDESSELLVVPVSGGPPSQLSPKDTDCRSPHWLPAAAAVTSRT